MHVNINPEPAQHSGVPVPVAGCDNHPYTWYYEQVIVNDSGLAMTITDRENFFDNRYTSTTREAIQIRGNGTITIRTRWCSGYPKPHFAQTRLNGRREDGQPFIFSERHVRLLSP
jgi:hypothetical protein